MQFYRDEILPNVYLTALKTDKFKTGCMSATLLAPLTRDTAAAHACIPYILRRGTVSLPDLDAVSARLDDLYGAKLEPVVRKLGEIQAIGFLATFCEDRFLPGQTDLLEDMAQLMAEMWLRPNTKGGLFRPAYVESEGEKLAQRIESAMNDKTRYAIARLIANMCSYEDYAVGALGESEDALDLHYVGLTKDYRALLSTSPMELFYCGSADPRQVHRALEAAFTTMSRGEIDEDLGTDIRMNAVEENVRYFTEELEVSQGKLAVGFRLGDCMDDPDQAAMLVFNAVFGGGPASRLFEHVRQEKSLCYHVSSSMDIHKGILLAVAGIDFDQYDAALGEILAQLEDLRQGGVTVQELESARNYVAGRCRSLGDSPTALEDFYLEQTVLGLEYSPMELAALVESVTAEEVTAIAQSVVCDAVYFLRGEESEE